MEQWEKGETMDTKSFDALIPKDMAEKAGAMRAISERPPGSR